MKRVRITFTTLWANSADINLIYFLFFSQKTGFDIFMQLAPLETIYMKCQNLFSGKSKKNISVYHLLKVLSRVLSI